MKTIYALLFACLLTSCSNTDEKTYKVIPYACAPNSTCLTYFNNNRGNITCYIEDVDTKQITPLSLKLDQIKQVLCDSASPHIKVVSYTPDGYSYYTKTYYVWYSRNELSPFGPIFDIPKQQDTAKVTPSNIQTK